jgi:hypothetical protein
MRFLRAWILTCAALTAGARPTAAQQPDSARLPTAAFVGRMISNLDSTPVRSADIRRLPSTASDNCATETGTTRLEVFADSIAHALP